MEVHSAAALVERIRQFHLLRPEQLAELGSGALRFTTSARSLALDLLHRGWLTRYQVEELLNGRTDGLTLGGYVLLDVLGEGGMGLVYKARQPRLDRIVAIKRIKPERLENEHAIRRFRREVHSAAQLHHPNIVMAFDADEVDGIHFLVMEYVDGRDLARVVRERGPLPVATACDYIGQASLGLQHAHDRGLIHRDIKPANLLVTRSGQIKILDMGLARGHTSLNESDPTASMITHEGAVLGSIDFIAPEQAMDSHRIDPRADQYSLGCTFYYLLTGQVPFPNLEALAKLLKHRLEEPTPVEQMRSDVPVPVSQILRRMMAKQPALRFANMAEVAAALASVGQIPLPPVPTLAPLPLVVPASEDSPTTQLEPLPALQATAVLPRRLDPPKPPNWHMATLLSLVLLVGLVALSWPRDAGTSPVADLVESSPEPKAPFAAIDLLARIDPRRHAVSGSWKRVERDTVLLSPTGPFDRLQLPYRPPDEYHLTAVVQRRKGNNSLNLGLVIGGRRCVVVLDGWEERKLSGLELIDGKTLNLQPMIEGRSLLVERRNARILCQVRPDRLDVAIDGKHLFRWQGDAVHLSLADSWQVPDARALFVGTFMSSFSFHKLEVQPLSGPGETIE